eukprot:869887-Alexandrium_andersonii.AAC.1
MVILAMHIPLSRERELLKLHAQLVCARGCCNLPARVAEAQCDFGRPAMYARARRVFTMLFSRLVVVA